MRYDVTSDTRLHVRGDALLPTPVVIRVVDIDEDGTNAFTKDMERAHQTGQPVIPVVIDSYGGNAYDVLSMIEQVRASRLPVLTIVEGKAMSAGAILFSFGTYRFMGARARLMIHDVSSEVEGKTHDVSADAAEITSLSESFFREMARNCGKSENHFLDELDRRKHAEWYLSAKEAKAHGFITSIGLPLLSMSVTVVDSLVGPDGHPLLTGARESRNVTATPKKRKAR